MDEAVATLFDLSIRDYSISKILKNVSGIRVMVAKTVGTNIDADVVDGIRQLCDFEHDEDPRTMRFKRQPT